MKHFIVKKIIGNKVLIFFIHTVLIALICYIDYSINSTLSLIIAYILPIASVSWFLGKYPGIIVSIIASIPELTISLIPMTPSNDLFINVWNIACKLFVYILIAYLISSVKKLRESERELVRTDFLTGINNISYFYELGDIELERVRRSGIPLTIIYIDIDDLRSINDSFGFLEGDRLLQTVAKSIKDNLRITDTAARLDSDEFAILLPGSDYNNSEIVIKRIHGILNDVINRNNWPATVTIGAVTYLSAPESIDHLVTNAEELMYDAKQTGNNNIMHNVITKLQLIVDEENQCDRQ